MLTKQKFDSYTWNIKLYVTLNLGKCIDTRLENNQYRISLYHLKDFYVEIYHNIRRNHIERAESVTEDFVLNNYVDMKELRELIFPLKTIF